MKLNIFQISIDSDDEGAVAWFNRKRAAGRRENRVHPHDEKNSLSKSSFIRAQRAQLALAGMTVSGWPFDDLCSCAAPKVGLYDPAYCWRCNKNVR